MLYHSYTLREKLGNPFSLRNGLEWCTSYYLLYSVYGAETCELVGSFLLLQLQDLDIDTGLYQDDGLAISNATPRETENIKKQTSHIFSLQNGLLIIIDANKQIIIFLDITFNNNTYQPFTKPSTMLQYVHRKSNNPLITTKNIPAGINKWLSSLSSDKALYNSCVLVSMCHKLC